MEGRMDGGKAGSQTETDRPPFYLGQRGFGYLCKQKRDKDAGTGIEN